MFVQAKTNINQVAETYNLIFSEDKYERKSNY